MSRKFFKKKRLVLSIVIGTLFIITGLSSVTPSAVAAGEDNDWNFWTNPPHLYTIPTGNVGIGVANPVDKLDVGGNIRVEGWIVGNSATGILKLYGDREAPASGVVAVLDNGNVGIGTSTPSDKLDIVGSLRVQGWIAGPSTFGKLSLYGDRESGTSQGLHLLDNGRVGIGRTDPQTKLHVVSTSGNDNGNRDLPIAIFERDYGYNHNGLRIRSDYGDGRNYDMFYNTGGNGEPEGLFFDLNTRGVSSNFDTTSSEMVIKPNGFVGIATNSPMYYLDVAGTAQVTGFRMPTSAVNGYVLTSNSYGVGTWQPAPSGNGIGGSGSTNYLAKFTGSTTIGNSVIYDNGNVGIGTSSPASKLDVNGDIRASILYDKQDTSYYMDPASVSKLNDLRASIMYDRDNTAYYVNPASTSKFYAINLGGVTRTTWPSSGSDSDWIISGNNMYSGVSGNVGIGTSSPNAKVTIKGSTSGAVLLNGYNSAGQLVFEVGEGLDYAETFPVSQKTLTPGTVTVIDPDNPGNLMISTEAYDTKVAGIVSGANGLNYGVRLGTEVANGQPIALSGRVYCKVDSQYGDIHPGDLLTTSPTPGHAMVVQDYSKAQGAIIGKAMESCVGGGIGQILVLVTLQ